MIIIITIVIIMINLQLSLKSEDSLLYFLFLYLFVRLIEKKRNPKKGDIRTTRNCLRTFPLQPSGLK